MLSLTIILSISTFFLLSNASPPIAARAVSQFRSLNINGNNIRAFIITLEFDQAIVGAPSHILSGIKEVARVSCGSSIQWNTIINEIESVQNAESTLLSFSDLHTVVGFLGGYPTQDGFRPNLIELVKIISTTVDDKPQLFDPSTNEFSIGSCGQKSVSFSPGSLMNLAGEAVAVNPIIISSVTTSTKNLNDIAQSNEVHFSPDTTSIAGVLAGDGIKVTGLAPGSESIYLTFNITSSIIIDTAKYPTAYLGVLQPNALDVLPAQGIRVTISDESITAEITQDGTYVPVKLRLDWFTKVSEINVVNSRNAISKQSTAEAVHTIQATTKVARFAPSSPHAVSIVAQSSGKDSLSSAIAPRMSTTSSPRNDPINAASAVHRQSVDDTNLLCPLPLMNLK